MCIIFLLYQVHPLYPLIIASNRDEHLDRPTESMKLRSTTIISGGGANEEKKNYASDDATTATATAATNNNDGDTTQHDFLKQQQQRKQRRRSSLSGKDLVCGGTWLALDISSIMDHIDNNNDDDGKSSDNNKDSKHVAANHDDSTTTPSLFRWIAITNYREKEEQHGRPSRGGLLTDYIQATTTTEDYDHDSSRGSSSSSSSSKLQSAQSFIHKLQQDKGQEYNGFNLLVGDDTGIYYYGNRNDHDNTITTNNTTATTPPPTSTPKPLPPGIYGLSNSLLDTPWPKVQRGKELLQQLLLQQQQLHNSNKNSNSNNSNSNSNNNIEEEEQQSDMSSSLHQLHEQLMTILTDTTQPSQNSQLPNTGIGIQSERHLSSIFVPQCIFMGKEYGTRTSTSVVWNAKGELSVLERTWLHPGHVDEWFHFGNKEGRRWR